MNKFGDMFFYMFMVLSYSFYKTFDFYLLFSLIGADVTTTDLIFLNINKIDILAISLVIAAIGKSAQLGLHSWLPDAMEGPTPVSALLHSATMVTAGIYMIARSNILYTLAPATETIVAIVGVITAVFAASVALKQNDIKKVLAYSTVSQLGYMFLGLPY